MKFEPDALVPLLPFLLPAALMAYALTVTIGGTILKRKRRRDEIARRARDPRQPWDRWLDEINRKINEEKRPGVIEKWRE